MANLKPLAFLGLCGLGLFVLSGNSSARQAFINNSADIPGGASNASSCENIDFGDVDQDGDWDAILANGGDDGNDQNRIWINQGGLQMGTTGFFADETGTRFPALADDSRDIEFVDLDDDGDLDIYTSNTAQIAQQGNRWWINDGGQQGGTLGEYIDETGSRWVNLGGVGSSIPGGLLIDDGLGNSQDTFIDWSCDCDFGDLDNDGDMDLVHSSYGGAFGGQVPTRIFLNDGDGFFEEFNPSNFQIPVQTILPGFPGLWCEGVQQTNTTDSTGAFCDIASSALDIDVGDIDGDLDLDILHGARQEPPRMFENRLEENGGSLGFRDITGSAYPAGYQEGDGHYEQEFGDMDNDGDLDVYGLNWQGQTSAFDDFEDVTLVNDGTGTYSGTTILSGSGADDNEGDFIDYDNDGDLDLFVCNFSGRDKLYRNDTTTPGTIVMTNVTTSQTPNMNRIGLDADAADVDNDGDYDLFVANDDFVENWYFQNNTQIPDTTASSLYRLEAVTGGGTSATDEVVRVQVYDNAPYYTTWYNETELKVTVNGIAVPDFAMKSSGGQIFRGELPGNLLGSVSYHAESTDEHGNTGSSSTEGYTNTGPGGTLYGSTSDSSQGGPPTIEVLTSPYAGKPLYVVGGNVSPGSFGAFGYSLNSGSLNVGDGLIINLSLPLLGELIPGTADLGGRMLLGIGKAPLVLQGMSLYLQFGALDGAGGATWAASRGLRLDFQ